MGKIYWNGNCVPFLSTVSAENSFYYKKYPVSYNIHAEALVGLHAQNKFLLPDSDHDSNVSTHFSKTL